MTSEIQLFIVTDNPNAACRAVLFCMVEELPPFVAIAATADEIRRIPIGSRCYGHWSAWSDHRPTEAMMAWRERRDQATVTGTTSHFLDRVFGWLRDREQRILDEARNTPSETSAFDAPERVAERIETPAKTRLY